MTLLSIARRKLPPQVKLEYPQLMIADRTGVVVLMTGSEGIDGQGMVVNTGNKDSGYELGYASVCWNMRDLKPYHGTVELSNG